VKALVERSLAGSQPPADLVAEALAALDPATARRLFSRPLISAAVLLPLLEVQGQLHVLLTLRSQGLRDHAGQISFPGGCMEAGECDPAQTALREAREEIGLDPDFIKVAGYLRPLTVVTGYAVSPVVGFLLPGHQLAPDPREVAEIFTVPLHWLRQPENLGRTRREVCGVELPVYEYIWQGHRIWGATAQMLRLFCRSLDEPA